ncbi:MAG: hypothetical protein OXG35_13075 [Acidobacteria bacterium]|nr:hypothetical protein [Acidobacteriota bacterium]
MDNYELAILVLGFVSLAVIDTRNTLALKRSIEQWGKDMTDHVEQMRTDFNERIDQTDTLMERCARTSANGSRACRRNAAPRRHSHRAAGFKRGTGNSMTMPDGFDERLRTLRRYLGAQIDYRYHMLGESIWHRVAAAQARLEAAPTTTPGPKKPINRAKTPTRNR